MQAKLNLQRIGFVMGKLLVKWSLAHKQSICLIPVLSAPMRIAINSLAPGRFQWKFKWVIFKQILATVGLSISCEIVLK